MAGNDHEPLSRSGWSPAARRKTPPGPSAGRLPAAAPLDAKADDLFDRYAELVHETLDVPAALVSLVSVDGQVFPGAVGLTGDWADARATPLTHSFCQMW